MAVLVEEVVDGEDSEERLPSLDTLLELLSVPAEYARYAEIEDREVIERLGAWKGRVEGTLRSVQKLLQQHPETSKDESARVVFSVAPFLAEADWSSKAARALATGHTSHFSLSTPSSVTDIAAAEILDGFCRFDRQDASLTIFALNTY